MDGQTISNNNTKMDEYMTLRLSKWLDFNLLFSLN